MTQTELKELIDREPFQPLKVTLTSSEVIEIIDARAVVVMRTQFFIALPNDRYKLVWLRHVASVEVLQAA
jgi:hypothetical protein